MQYNTQGEDMCGSPANEEDFSAYLHRAVLRGIRDDRHSLWYQIGDRKVRRSLPFGASVYVVIVILLLFIS